MRRHKIVDVGAMLLSWVLVRPPHDSSMIGFVSFDEKAALDKWERYRRFDTQEECERKATIDRRLGGLDAADDSWTRFYAAARCIRDDAAPSPTPKPAD